MWGRYPSLSRPILAFWLITVLSTLSMTGWTQNKPPDREISTLPPSATNTLIPATSTPTPTPAPTVEPKAARFPAGASTANLSAIHSLWLSPALPENITTPISLLVGWVAAPDAESADVRLEVGSDHVVSRFIFALVAPFPTVLDDVSAKTLRQAWSGQGDGPVRGNPPLMMDANTRDVLAAWWGAPGKSAVQVLPTAGLLDTAWFSGSAWAILPFESIEPRWKVLSVDGHSPLRKEFDPDSYALTVPISMHGEDALVQQAQGILKLPALNRDPGKLTTLIMTGTTAMVRGTAALMNSKGVDYPGSAIADTLRAADLTHISNEISFTPKCPLPDPFSQASLFCSDPRYLGLLEYVGTKIVELSGNHVADYGSQAMLDTITAYDRQGWVYFGGGKNLEDARKPVIINHHGNKLAFIGCNPVGPEYAWATADRPGAAPCDDLPIRHNKTVNEYTSNYAYIEAQIRRLRVEGYLPIVTLQYREYEYYPPEPTQQIIFRRMADAGAIIVSGSQAHHPQTVDFNSAAFIHYGLGNLFFDQIVLGDEYQNAFIDRHVFYDGQYLGVEILTIRFEDQARPRFMTPEERKMFLSTVFCGSGWSDFCAGVSLRPTPTPE
jgi:hypothetical protein